MTDRPRPPSSSSTACGCTPARGSPGSTCSRGRLRTHRAGLARRPGHRRGARANPDGIADHGIDEVTEHYAGIIDELPAPPILIGHSFGGMIAEKLLGEDLGAAAIAIDAAQIKGVLPLPLSALRSTLPVFKNPANKHRAVSLTAEQFRYASATRSARRSPTSCTSAGRSPRPASRCSRPPRPTSPRTRRPRSTPTTPDARAAAADHGRQGPHRARGHHQGHAQAVPATPTRSPNWSSSPTAGTRLTIDSGWREVADECLAWLAKQGL